METLYQYSIYQEEQNHAFPNTQLLSCDCFIFNLHFTHQLQLYYPQHVFFPLNSIQESFVVPCNVFFTHTHDTINTILSGTGVSLDFIEALVPEVYSFALDVVTVFENGDPDEYKVVPFNLGVVAVTPYDDHDQIERAIWESGQVFNPVPATRSSIAALKKVKVENLSVVNECSICLEEFSAGLEVIGMPCNHVYHKDCIVEWLKRSHLCPLCRYYGYMMEETSTIQFSSSSKNCWASVSHCMNHFEVSIVYILHISTLLLLDLLLHEHIKDSLEVKTKLKILLHYPSKCKQLYGHSWAPLIILRPVHHRSREEKFSVTSC
ncbi:hypothetical protein ACLB2K_015496 [Fragaria x ananassa]